MNAEWPAQRPARAQLHPLRMARRPERTVAARLKTARLSATSVWTRPKTPSSVCVDISSGETLLSDAHETLRDADCVITALFSLLCPDLLQLAVSASGKCSVRMIM